MRKHDKNKIRMLEYIYIYNIYNIIYIYIIIYNIIYIYIYIQ